MNFEGLRKINRWHLFRIFILILLPFILGTIFIPHTHRIVGGYLDTPSEIRRNFTFTPEYSYNQNLNESAHYEQIKSVFPFAEYLSFYPLVYIRDPQVCFEDQGSLISYSDGVDVPANFNWVINLNNGKNITLATRTVSCTNVNFDRTFRYGWSAQIPIDYIIQSGVSTKLTPKTVSYVQYTLDYGLMQGLALIPAMFLLVWYPIAGIWRKIHRGLLEQ